MNLTKFQQSELKRFDEWRNDGEHESLSDKNGYVDKFDFIMFEEFLLSSIEKAYDLGKEEKGKVLDKMKIVNINKNKNSGTTKNIKTND